MIGIDPNASHAERISQHEIRFCYQFYCIFLFVLPYVYQHQADIENKCKQPIGQLTEATSNQLQNYTTHLHGAELLQVVKEFYYFFFRLISVKELCVFHFVRNDVTYIRSKRLNLL